MPTFKPMRRWRKEFKAELSAFDWTKASSKTGATFDPAGVREAKKLIKKALGEDLTRPYGKVGVVGQDLVFRIKHGRSKHYGKGDIVLIADFKASSKGVGTSRGGKDGSVLTAVKTRNPIDVGWWTSTLGGTPDKAGIGKALGAYLEARAVTGTKKVDREGWDLAIERCRAVERAAAKARRVYPGKNDQKILDRLDKALLGQMKKLHDRAGAYATGCRQAAEEVASVSSKDIAKMLGDARQRLNSVRDFLDRSSVGGVEMNLSIAWSMVNRSHELCFAEGLADHIAMAAKAQDVRPEDLPLDAISSTLRKNRDRAETMLAEVESLQDRYDRLSSGNGTEAERVSTAFVKLKKDAKAGETAVERATSLIESLGMFTSYGKSLDAWIDVAEEEHTAWVQRAEAIDQAAASLEERSEKADRARLKTLRKELDRERRRYDKVVGEGVQAGRAFQKGRPALYRTCAKKVVKLYDEALAADRYARDLAQMAIANPHFAKDDPKLGMKGIRAAIQAFEKAVDTLWEAQVPRHNGLRLVGAAASLGRAVGASDRQKMQDIRQWVDPKYRHGVKVHHEALEDLANEAEKALEG